MSEFEEKLGAILSDNDAMGQIMALARSLSGGEEAPSQEEKPPVSLPEPGRDAALLAALKPYLKPERQRKLDRALELLRMIRLMKGG